MKANKALNDSVFRRREKLACIPWLLVLVGILVLCWNSQARFTPVHEDTLIKKGIASDASLAFLSIGPTDNDTGHDDATSVDLSGYEYEYLISTGGYYRLTGALDGRVKIDAEDQYVHIVLQDVDIEAREGPALLVQSASKVVITLADGSKNTLSDSGNYRSFHDTESCVYSSCDLTINGTGSLIVNGFHEDAIRSRDVVRILDGNINITCLRTGIHGSDGIHVVGGSLFVSSRKDAFKTTKRGVNGRGSILVSGGKLNIIAGTHAFTCYQGDLYIHDCAIRAKTIISDYDVGGTQYVESGCMR